MDDPTSQRRSRAVLITVIILAALVATETLILILFVVAHSGAAPSSVDTLADQTDVQLDAGYEDPLLDAQDPLLRMRRVLLFHDVNSRTAKDVSARLMYLNSLDPKTPIDLYISTQGGWPDSAFAVIDTMRTISAPVNTWAVGGCYSAGTLILAAATGRRYATEDAILMIHANLDDSADAASYERLARERYEQVWRHTSSLPSSWYPMTDDKEHYLTAQEALDLKVVDEIVPVWRAKAGAVRPTD